MAAEAAALEATEVLRHSSTADCGCSANVLCLFLFLHLLCTAGLVRRRQREGAEVDLHWRMSEGFQRVPDGLDRVDRRLRSAIGLCRPVHCDCDHGQRRVRVAVQSVLALCLVRQRLQHVPRGLGHGRWIVHGAVRLLGRVQQGHGLLAVPHEEES